MRMLSMPRRKSSGIDEMCDYAEDVIQGRTILVREGVSRFGQFLRRHDCDSLLWFVEHEKLRKRRRILKAWSWTETILQEPGLGPSERHSDGT